MKDDKTGPMKPCKRSNGTLRAYFLSREDALNFARDPQNQPMYQPDEVPSLCQQCGFWHLNRLEWLGITTN